MDGDRLELVGGPQDGAFIKPVGGQFPSIVYVAVRNRGDGFAAWATHASKRFPVGYEWKGKKYRFIKHYSPIK